MEQPSLLMRFFAMVALVAFIFMVGGAFRNRPAVFLTAVTVMLVAIAVMSAMAFPYPAIRILFSGL